MAKDVLTCMNCDNVIGSERLKYAKCFCSDLCLTEFWANSRKRQESMTALKECANCKCSFLTHEEVTGEHGIGFCSRYCRMYFQCEKRLNSMVDNVDRGTNAAKKEPVLKLPRLTISDLFSLDNEEEFTQYLNDIIAEKTK